MFSLKLDIMATVKAKRKSAKRNPNDYWWIASFYAAMAFYNFNYLPAASKGDRDLLIEGVNYLGLEDPLGANYWNVLGFSLFETSIALLVINSVLFVILRLASPQHTPTDFLGSQISHIFINLALTLPAMDTIFLHLMHTFGGQWYIKDCPLEGGAYCADADGNMFGMFGLPYLGLVRDVALWLLCFELTWYTQHRLAHDNKFLWVHGHAYHHQWKTPEQMIGVTNYAFDHIIEVWVTMSSSFIPLMLLPINFWVLRVVGFMYAILAVLVHWDGFVWSRYHLNHHYLIAHNFGSHIPIFDMFFNTYYWGSFFPETENDWYPGVKPKDGRMATPMGKIGGAKKTE